MKSSKYFEKCNIYGVNFDSGIFISMQYIYVKECTTPPTKFYTSNLNFCVKTGSPLSWDMPYVISINQLSASLMYLVQ